MVDDSKHTEAVKVWLTERELLDLSRMAAREDRKVSEMARVMVRRSMYGSMGVTPEEVHRAISPE